MDSNCGNMFQKSLYSEREQETTRAETSSSTRKDKRKRKHSREKDPRTKKRKPAFRYQELFILGEGGYGRVYAGFREPDVLEVAIKHIPLELVQWTEVKKNGRRKDVPLEVVLMQKAAGGHSVGSTAAISLLDWHIKDDELILVMERPSPCTDLYDYVNKNGGFLEEKEAKNIMHQLVEAAADLHSKGVFHRDIKEENVLIEWRAGDLRARLIDFGCGTQVKEGHYHSFKGDFPPPEFFQQRKYRAAPTTVWQLGVLLYGLLEGSVPFDMQTFLHKNINMDLNVSQNCLDFVDKCLCKCPEERADFEQLMRHPWLQ